MLIGENEIGSTSSGKLSIAIPNGCVLEEINLMTAPKVDMLMMMIPLNHIGTPAGIAGVLGYDASKEVVYLARASASDIF